MNVPLRFSLFSCSLIIFLLSNACIAYSTKIVGGKFVENVSEIPWQAAIASNEGNLYQDQFCAGSIISDQAIITAAHCFFDFDTGEVRRDEFVVAIGETNLIDATFSENLYVFTAQEHVHIHPRYNQSRSLEHDIAVIILPEPMDLTRCEDPCTPIQLVTTGIEDAVAGIGAEALTSGWGTTTGYTPINQFGEPPEDYEYTWDPRLKKLDMLIRECGTTPEYTANMICAGAVNMNTEDTCQADSGGPLAVPNLEETDYLLAGIISWGYGCAAGVAGAYTRVSSYTNWISSLLSDLDNPPIFIEDQEAPAPATARSSSGGSSTDLVLLLGLAGLGVYKRFLYKG